MARKIKFRGEIYRSIKHPILEHIFDLKTESKRSGIGDNHRFTLQDIGRAMDTLYDELEYKPTSHSNFVLDLTRKDSGIESRLPASLISLGYDLKKKTGPAPNGENYAGVFVYVGVGNAISTWLKWPETPEQVITIDNIVPADIIPYLSNDEGALFSVIDYCDVLSACIYREPKTILRVQNPMKWQPNEIDGLYYSHFSGIKTLFPVEAKALSTGDAINLEQMSGAYRTLRNRRPDVEIISLGIRMITNGMDIAVFGGDQEDVIFERSIRVQLSPELEPWT